MKWRVESYIKTPKGEIPVELAGKEEKTRLAQNIYWAVAKAVTPAGYEVLLLPQKGTTEKAAVGGVGLDGES